jgi:hypothetical protein
MSFGLGRSKCGCLNVGFVGEPLRRILGGIGGCVIGSAAMLWGWVNRSGFKSTLRLPWRCNLRSRFY